MSSRVDLADLLDTARDLFRAELSDGLPAEKRYAAAMLASALAIASRGLLVGEEPRQSAYLRLYGDEAADLTIEDLERRAVADIRAGRFDSANAGRLRALLLQRTIHRLKISDPDALAASGFN